MLRVFLCMLLSVTPPPLPSQRGTVATKIESLRSAIVMERNNLESSSWCGGRYRRLRTGVQILRLRVGIFSRIPPFCNIFVIMILEWAYFPIPARSFVIYKKFTGLLEIYLVGVCRTGYFLDLARGGVFFVFCKKKHAST